MKHHLLVPALAALLFTSAPFAQIGSAGSPQLDLPRATLRAGKQTIDVQVAQTPEQRQIGLMHRRQMPQQEGMLFVFEQPGVQCFWMKNTRLPLTAAFVADDGSIVNLADMLPMSERQHCSERPVRYVLEMNKGWFKRHKLGPGTQLKMVPSGS